MTVNESVHKLFYGLIYGLLQICGIKRSHGSVYGLLRVYRTKKYRPNVVALIQHMLDIGVDRVIVIVSGPMDTQRTFEVIADKFPDSERVFAMKSEEYKAPNCWSLALNAGIKFIAESFGIKKGDRLLVFSNEVALTEKGLRRMKEAMVSGIGVVGIKFLGFTARSYIETPRNTLSLWDLYWLVGHRGFLEECDSLAGMEDYANVLRLKKEGLETVILKPDGDVELFVNSVTCQSKKEETECRAMQIIEEKCGFLFVFRNSRF